MPTSDRFLYLLSFPICKMRRWMEPSQSCLRRNELIPVKHVSWAWLIVCKGLVSWAWLIVSKGLVSWAWLIVSKGFGGGHCFLFIWLCQVLAMAHGIFDLHCSMQTVSHMESSPLTRDQTQPPALGARRPSHWTTREVPNPSVLGSHSPSVVLDQ